MLTELNITNKAASARQFVMHSLLLLLLLRHVLQLLLLLLLLLVFDFMPAAYVLRFKILKNAVAVADVAQKRLFIRSFRHRIVV